MIEFIIGLICGMLSIVLVSCVLVNGEWRREK